MKGILWSFLAGVVLGGGSAWILDRPAPGPSAAQVSAAEASRDSARAALDSLRARSDSAYAELARVNAAADSERQVAPRAVVVKPGEVRIQSEHAGQPPALVDVPAEVTAQLAQDQRTIAALTAARDSAMVALARLRETVRADDALVIATDRANELTADALRAQVAHLKHQLTPWKVGAVALLAVVVLRR